jgi:hypothetical protein
MRQCFEALLRKAPQHEEQLKHFTLRRRAEALAKAGPRRVRRWGAV